MSNSYLVLALGPDSEMAASLISTACKARDCLGYAQQLALLSSLPHFLSLSFSLPPSLASLTHLYSVVFCFGFFLLQLSTSLCLFPPFLSSLSYSASVLPFLFLICSLPFPGVPLHWKAPTRRVGPTRPARDV